MVKKFHNVKSKLALMQLYNIPTCPLPRSQAGTSVYTSLPQEAVLSSEAAPQTNSLKTRQAKSPQPLLTGYAFQPLLQFWCPPLGTFKDLHVCLKLWGPEVHTVLKVSSRKHSRKQTGVSVVDLRPML